MKLQRALVAVLIYGSIATVHAEDYVDKTKVHEVAFDGCHFKLTDPYKGRITGASYFATINSKSLHTPEIWIQFSCEKPVTPKTYLDSASIKLTTRGWVLDTSKEDPNPPSLRTTLYALHGKDWEGAGTTQDDTVGDERRRARAFNFCIPHQQLALCGSLERVVYLMWPKETTLPQVIKLLESIEFTDDATPTQAASAPLHSQ